MNIKPLEYINALDRFSTAMDKISTVYDENNDSIYKPISDALGIGRLDVMFTEIGGKPFNACIFGSSEPAQGMTHKQRSVAQNGSVADYTLYKKDGFPDWDDEDKEIISGFVKVMFVFHGRLEMIKSAKKMLFVDWATETGNLRAFFMSINKAAAKNELDGYGVCRFNIKHFSQVNRLYGRETGTVIMKDYITGLMNKVPGCSVYRIGGDNFTAMFKKQDFEAVKAYLKGAVVKIDLPVPTEVKLYSTAGFYLCKVGETQDDIMGRITMGVAMAKSMSKNDVFVYDDNAEKMIERRKQIEDKFWEGIEAGEFVAYYQPKVDIMTGKVIGTEALCRWVKPDGSVIPPMEFIPVLEQSIAICKLDFYILDRVCKDIRNWLNMGNSGVKASVNISRMHLGDERLLEKVLDIIDRNNVPHELIEIELTETTTDVDFDELRRIVGGLHEHGISASVDDFGIGYSSLTLIKELPWDVLKIDRSFLPNGGENDEQKSIMLRHVVSMAQGLGLQCIIEGVETLEQIELLKDMNCRLVQGFYYDKPLPKLEFESRLKKHYTV